MVRLIPQPWVLYKPTDYFEGSIKTLIGVSIGGLGALTKPVVGLIQPHRGDAELLNSLSNSWIALGLPRQKESPAPPL